MCLCVYVCVRVCASVSVLRIRFRSVNPTGPSRPRRHQPWHHRLTNLRTGITLSAARPSDPTLIPYVSTARRLSVLVRNKYNTIFYCNIIIIVVTYIFIQCVNFDILCIYTTDCPVLYIFFFLILFFLFFSCVYFFSFLFVFFILRMICAAALYIVASRVVEKDQFQRPKRPHTIDNITEGIEYYEKKKKTL